MKNRRALQTNYDTFTETLPVGVSPVCVRRICYVIFILKLIVQSSVRHEVNPISLLDRGLVSFLTVFPSRHYRREQRLCRCRPLEMFIFQYRHKL